MTLFYMTIPLFVLAILVAAVPLVVVSRREVLDLVREAEMRFERHHREHPGRRDSKTASASASASASEGRRPPIAVSRQQEKPWHEPVLLERR